VCLARFVFFFFFFPNLPSVYFFPSHRESGNGNWKSGKKKYSFPFISNSEVIYENSHWASELITEDVKAGPEGDAEDANGSLVFSIVRLSLRRPTR